MREAGFKNTRIKPSNYSGDGRLLLHITKRIYEGILQTGVSNNVFTASEIDDWWKTLDEDANRGDLFLSYQGFTVSGTVD